MKVYLNGRKSQPLPWLYKNLWLTATEMGLGGYWSTPAYVDQIGGFVSMEEGETCLGLLYLGAFEGSTPTRKPSDWREKVQWYD